MSEHHAGGEEIAAWVLVQKKTFTKWMNGHLRKKSYPPIGDLANEFDTGVNLMHLINALYEIEIPKHNKAPKLRAHQLDNCELALRMVAQAQVKTNFLGTHHLVDHDLKMLLGMVWAIILDYQIKGISVDDLTAKEGLLLWVQQKTRGYRDVNVQNFTSSFQDGLAFCALIHKFRPDLIPYDDLKKENRDHNLELAFATAEQHLGIPRLLDVQDMKDPDDKSVMTYVSEYYHKLAEYEKTLALSARVKRFLQLAKNIHELKDFYTENSPPFSQWLNEKIALFGDLNYENTIDNCKSLLYKLVDYQANEKTSKIARKFELQGKFQNLQALLSANKMPGYVAPAGAEPETIEDLWNQLEEIEKKRHQKLTGQLQEHFGKMFKTFDKENKGKLNVIEFKACLNAIGEKLSDLELELLFSKSEADENGHRYLTFQQFSDFLMSYFSSVDSPDDIKRGFRFVCNNKDYALPEDFKKLDLSQDLFSWSTTHMPQKKTGLDYETFTDAQWQ